MKILADANPLYAGHLTGIGYYTDELLKHLAKISDVEGFAFNFRNAKKISTTYKIHEQRVLPGKLLSYPRYAKIDLQLNTFFDLSCADVVLGTNYLLPPTGNIPNVITVHDMCIIDHPEWVQERNAHIMRMMLGKTIARSKALITISEFSKSRILEIYGYQNPVLVVAIPPKKSNAGLKRPAAIASVHSEKFFLFISTIEPRKNISTLLNAFEALPTVLQQEYPLILAGKPGWDPKVLQRLRLGTNKNIHYLDYVTESERNWLYKNATATVIPSHYEGFGMMTLESLDAGTPTIVSNIPPQIEILGDAGEYFDPLDANSLAAILHQFTNPKYRSRALQKQKPALSRYSWDNVADSVHSFLTNVIL